MRILVLGSSAGGGLPQWNCNCSNCRAARSGDPKVPPRDQPSLALSSNGDDWHLLNAGPDIRQQINAHPPLHPAKGIRHTPIASITLTNADIDHILGLLILRESRPYTIFSTPWVKHAVLNANRVFQLLERPPQPVRWEAFQLEQPFRLPGADSIEITPFPVPGKVPLYLMDSCENSPEATIGLRVRDLLSGRVCVFIPGLQEFNERIHGEIEGADLLFMDGTTFTDTEMQDLGVADAPTSRKMGHWPIGGEDGTATLLRKKTDLRKIFIHINNTNPMLREDSKEAGWVREAGWEIAREGMMIDL